MFLELCKDFVYFLSSEIDLIGVCRCFSRQASAKWAFLCYNERSIKMEKNVSIENYKPDFAVEAAYDLTVADLKKQGIKAVLVDLDNTLIAWNNPDGTPEMRQWLHDLRDGGCRAYRGV